MPVVFSFIFYIFNISKRGRFLFFFLDIVLLKRFTYTNFA